MDDVGGTWTEQQVAGHLVDVFEPEVPSAHGYVVIYLHGVSLTRLTGNGVFSRLFARHGLRVAAPMTGKTWWTNRTSRAFDPLLSPEQYLLAHVLPWVSERWAAKPPRIALLGTSMGGQGALRLAFKHPNTFPIVAAMAPAIDYQKRIAEGDRILAAMYDDAEAVRQDTATLHVHPLNWPRNTWFCCDPDDDRWFESAERLQMKLYSLGIPHECDLLTRAGGHGFAYYDHMAQAALAFIADRLEREWLR